jgi:hypothetical protein
MSAIERYFLEYIRINMENKYVSDQLRGLGTVSWPKYE